ncbi:MAG: phospholipid carrier-dependent glycosyltransferase [Elainella sp.]
MSPVQVSARPKDSRSMPRWFLVGMAGIFLASLALRFWGLSRFNTLVFDEVYYAKFASAFLKREIVFTGHPPLSTYIIAFGIWLGEKLPWGQSQPQNDLAGLMLNPFSYRWLNALTGALIPPLVAAIAYQLTRRYGYALIAALLMAMDGLFLVESRYALNNVYLISLGLLGHLFLLMAFRATAGRRWLYLVLAGVGLGGAAAIKWNGLGFWLGAVAVWLLSWMLYWLDHSSGLQQRLKQWAEAITPARQSSRTGSQHRERASQIGLPINSRLKTTSTAPRAGSRGVNRPANQPVNQPVNQPASRSTPRSTSQSASGVPGRPTSRSAGQSAERRFFAFNQAPPHLIQAVVAFGVVPALTYYASWLPYMQVDNSDSNFWQLQAQTYDYHKRVGGLDAHPYCSLWYTWPLMLRPVAYYYQTGSPAPTVGPSLPNAAASAIYDVHAMGNPILWWFSTAAVVLLALVAVAVLGQKLLLTEAQGQHSLANSSALSFWATAYLLINWGANFLPWVRVTRCLFIYHYMESLIFAVMLLALILERWFQSRQTWQRTAALFVTGAILLGFLFWMPLFLGLPLSPEELQLRRWLNSWV